MTRQVLRVPRTPPLPTPDSWFRLLGPPEAFVAFDGVHSAVYYNGKTYFGYIDGNGNVHVSSYNHATGAVVTSPAIVTGLAVDRHTTPSVLVRQSDQKLLVAVAPHNTAHMYIAVSTNAEDASAFGAATDINATLGGTFYTYPCLVQLSGESGKIYLFYRDNQAPNILAYSTSTDGGATWTAETQLYKNGTANCYWVIGSDATSRIDFVASDGAASAGETASLYHFYYTGGSRYKSDGTLISASLPLAPASLTKIFDAATSGSVRLPYSVVAGSPLTAAWAAYDTAGSGQPEKYWYGVYTGGAWVVNEIADSGHAPDINTLLEGGAAIDRVDTASVYVSRYVSGLWQMLLYETADGGSTWSSTQLTADASQPSYRPTTPQNAAAALLALWCSGPIGAGDLSFGSQIRGYPNPVHL